VPAKAQVAIVALEAQEVLQESAAFASSEPADDPARSGASAATACRVTGETASSAVTKVVTLAD
jgi:hypothetical protein